MPHVSDLQNKKQQSYVGIVGPLCVERNQHISKLSSRRRGRSNDTRSLRQLSTCYLANLNCGDLADQTHQTPQSKLLFFNLHHLTRVCAFLSFLKTLEGEAMWTSTSIATSVRSCRLYQALVQLCHQFEMSSQVKPVDFCLIFCPKFHW